MSVSEILSHEVVIELVHEASNPDKRKSLGRLVEAFLSSWLSGSAEAWFGWHEVGKHLQAPFRRFVAFCKCLAVLLRVDNPKWALTALDVAAITTEKLQDSFLKAIRNLLTTAEPAGPAQNKVKAASRELWMAEIQDVVKTAATHGPAAEKAATFLSELVQQIGNGNDDNDEETLPLPVVLSPGCTGNLDLIMESLPQLKLDMRKGFALPLQKAVRDRVVQLGSAILKATSPSLSSADLNSTMAGLKLFPADATCAEMHSKLISWATKHNADIAVADFHKWLDSYMSQVSTQSYREVIPVDVPNVKQVVTVLKVPLEDAEVLEKLHIMLPNFLVRCYLQVLLQVLRFKTFRLHNQKVCHSHSQVRSCVPESCFQNFTDIKVSQVLQHHWVLEGVCWWSVV